MSGISEKITAYMQINLQNNQRLSRFLNKPSALSEAEIIQWVHDFRDPEGQEDLLEKNQIEALSMLTLKLIDETCRAKLGMQIERIKKIERDIFLIFKIANQLGLLKNLLIYLSAPDKQRCFLLEDHCNRMTVFIPLIVQYWEESYRQIHELISSVEFLDPSSEAIESLKENLKRNKIPKEIHENLLLIPKNYFSQSYPDNDLFFEAWRGLLNREGDLLESMGKRRAFSIKKLNLLEGRGFHDLLYKLKTYREFNIKIYIDFYLNKLFDRDPPDFEKLIRCLSYFEEGSYLADSLRDLSRNYFELVTSFSYLGFRIALALKSPNVFIFKSPLEKRAEILASVQEDLQRPGNLLFTALESADISAGAHGDFEELLDLMKKAASPVEKIKVLAENFATAGEGSLRFKIVKEYLQPFYEEGGLSLEDDFSDIEIDLKALSYFFTHYFSEAAPSLWTLKQGPDSEDLRAIGNLSEEGILRSIFNVSDGSDPQKNIEKYLSSGGAKYWVEFKIKGPLFLMGSLKFPRFFPQLLGSGQRVLFSLITLYALQTRNKEIFQFLLKPGNPSVAFPQVIMNAIVYREEIPSAKEDVKFLLDFLEEFWLHNFAPLSQILRTLFKIIPEELTFRKNLEFLLEKAQIPEVLIQRLELIIDEHGYSDLSSQIHRMKHMGIIQNSYPVPMDQTDFQIITDVIHVFEHFIKKIGSSQIPLHFPLLERSELILLSTAVQELKEFCQAWKVPEIFIEENKFRSGISDLCSFVCKYFQYFPDTPSSLILQKRVFLNNSGRRSPRSLPLPLAQKIQRFNALGVFFARASKTNLKETLLLPLSKKGEVLHRKSKELFDKISGLLSFDEISPWDRWGILQTLRDSALELRKPGQRYEMFWEILKHNDGVHYAKPLRDDFESSIQLVRVFLQALCQEQELQFSRAISPVSSSSRSSLVLALPAAAPGPDYGAPYPDSRK